MQYLLGFRIETVDAAQAVGVATVEAHDLTTAKRAVLFELCDRFRVREIRRVTETDCPDRARELVHTEEWWCQQR